MKTPAVTALAVATLFSCPLQIAHAVEWLAETVPGFTAQRGAILSAMACDRADRDHLVFTSSDGTSFKLNYVLRPNRSAALASRFLSSSAFSHIAIDVSPDFRVFVAGVRSSDGAVMVYEFKEGEFSLFATAGTSASTAETGGVSIVAEGNGMTRTSIAYTHTDGRARFVQRTGPSTWNTPVQATIGAGSGQMPVLVSLQEGLSDPVFSPYAVFSYNATNRQVQVANFSTLGSIWLAGENIGPPLAEFTSAQSLSAAAFFGKPGVAFSVFDFGNHTVRYAQRTASGSGWTVQTITVASEMESDLDRFGQVAMAFDAVGHPIVAYARDKSTVTLPLTRDLWMRRFVPGYGWGELSNLATFPTDACRSDCGRINRIGMGTSGSGDPRLLFENPPSGFFTVGASDPVIAAPVGLQWPLETADAIAAHTFAPAMASLPGGGRCLVTGTAATSGVPGARTYQAPRLTIFRGTGSTIIPLPSSAHPHLANAVTATADGVIHVVSMRTANDTSAIGDLQYFRIEGSTVTGATVVDDNGSEGNIAARDQIALGADATGRLYLAFSGAGGELKLLTLPPGANLSPGQRPWERLASIPGSYRTVDLAARPDGGVIVSYYRRSPAEVGVYTNVEPKTGLLLAALGPVAVYSRPAAVAAEASNTTCAFDISGLPRLAFGFAGNFLVATSRRADLSGDPFALTSIPDFFLNPLVDMACSGTSIHIALLDGGTGRGLWRIEGQATPSSFGANTYAEISTLGLPPSALGGGVAIAMDHQGFGMIAAGLVSPDSTSSFDDVYLAREANGLDRDGDGVPLLYENAFCMNPNEPDAELMPQSSIRKFSVPVEGELVVPGFQHRFPSVPRTVLSNVASHLYGQFLYGFTTSSDLKVLNRYSTVTPLPGVTPSTSPLGEVSPGVAEQLIGLRTDASYRAAYPTSFFGLRVRRAR